jgi:hypothetical protein
MKIVDHGEWVACDKPENYPVKNLPPNVLFSKRASDGVDWYQFRKELKSRDTLKVLAVKATEDGGEWSVITTTYDVSELFPTSGMRLIELHDPPADHEKLRLQRLDLRKKSFSPPPPLPPTMMEVLIEELGLDKEKMQAKLDVLTNNRSRRNG